MHLGDVHGAIEVFVVLALELVVHRNGEALAHHLVLQIHQVVVAVLVEGCFISSVASVASSRLCHETGQLTVVTVPVNVEVHLEAIDLAGILELVETAGTVAGKSLVVADVVHLVIVRELVEVLAAAMVVGVGSPSAIPVARGALGEVAL